MKSINAKIIGISIIALVIGLGAVSVAEAASKLYPGSMCSFERQGTSGTLNKKKGAIQSTSRLGNVVTCPVPHANPTGDRFASGAVSISVTYLAANGHSPVSCMVRSASFSLGGINKHDSEVLSSEYVDNGEFFWEQLLIPYNRWVVLRCQIPGGARIVSYRVSSAD